MFANGMELASDPGGDKLALIGRDTVVYHLDFEAQHGAKLKMNCFPVGCGNVSF